MMALRPFIVAVAFVASSAALAHAFLDHASPAVGSQIRGAPGAVTLWFTQELEPALSSVKVLDPAGRQVDRADMSVDPRDATAVRVTLKPLAPGKYRVVWHALSVDSHATDGDFTFTVLP
jgi:methionine-rich copper-binding protein CopC